MFLGRSLIFYSKHHFQKCCSAALKFLWLTNQLNLNLPGNELQMSHTCSYISWHSTNIDFHRLTLKSNCKKLYLHLHLMQIRLHTYAVYNLYQQLCTRVKSVWCKTRAQHHDLRVHHFSLKKCGAALHFHFLRLREQICSANVLNANVYLTPIKRRAPATPANQPHSYTFTNNTARRWEFSLALRFQKKSSSRVHRHENMQWGSSKVNCGPS